MAGAGRMPGLPEFVITALVGLSAQWKSAAREDASDVGRSDAAGRRAFADRGR